MIAKDDCISTLQIPQILVLTMGEIMVSITGISFAYSQAPDSMKSLLQVSLQRKVGMNTRTRCKEGQGARKDKLLGIAYRCFLGVHDSNCIVFSQAGWLLTIFGGNLIDVIIMESGVCYYDSQPLCLFSGPFEIPSSTSHLSSRARFCISKAKMPLPPIYVVH